MGRTGPGHLEQVGAERRFFLGLLSIMNDHHHRFAPKCVFVEGGGVGWWSGETSLPGTCPLRGVLLSRAPTPLRTLRPAWDLFAGCPSEPGVCGPLRVLSCRGVGLRDGGTGDGEKGGRWSLNQVGHKSGAGGSWGEGVPTEVPRKASPSFAMGSGLFKHNTHVPPTPSPPKGCPRESLGEGGGLPLPMAVSPLSPPPAPRAGQAHKNRAESPSSFRARLLLRAEAPATDSLPGIQPVIN